MTLNNNVNVFYICVGFVMYYIKFQVQHMSWICCALLWPLSTKQNWLPHHQLCHHMPALNRFNARHPLTCIQLILPAVCDVYTTVGKHDWLLLQMLNGGHALLEGCINSLTGLGQSPLLKLFICPLLMA